MFLLVLVFVLAHIVFQADISHGRASGGLAAYYEAFERCRHPKLSSEDLETRSTIVA